MSTLTRFASLVCSCLLLVACPSDDGTGESSEGSETATTSTTGEEDGCSPAGEYAQCDPGSTAACMAGGGPDQCIVDDTSDPSIAVCGRPCTDVCECWAAPGSGDAPVACVSLAPGDDGTCILDCSGGQSCPDGMLCNELPTGAQLCVFPVN